MLDFVPIKFRENEAQAKSFLSCFECKSDKDHGQLYIDSCENYIMANEGQAYKPYCGSCIGNVRFYCNCDPKCKPTLSKSIQDAYNFYFVPCFTHTTTKAVSFTSNFLPICLECRQKYRVYKSLSYNEISENFFELFKSVSKSLCKDRKSKLVTYSTQEMLKACRWMHQINSGIFCAECPDTVSECVTENLEGACRKCLQSKDHYIPLGDFNQVSQRILDVVKQKCARADPFELNKYMIKMLRYNSHTLIKAPQDLNLLILEFQEINRTKYLTARCVVCLVKFTEAWKKGVKLVCGHSACFKCIFSKSFDNCPIDNEEISSSEFINISIQSKMILCHFEHAYNSQSNIYRLPCFHHSCKEHIQKGYCFQCGFQFTKWQNEPVQRVVKPRKSLDSLQSFYDLKCLVHNRVLSEFNLKTLTFYCDKCEKNANEKEIDTFSKHLALEHCIDKRNEKYLDFIESVKNYNMDSNIIKFFSYISIQNYHLRNYCVALLKTLLGHYGKIKSKKYFIVTEALDVRLWPRRKFLINEKFSVKLKFSLNSDIVLTGLILSRIYFPFTLPFINIGVSPISVEINFYQEDSDKILETKKIESLSIYPKQIKTEKSDFNSKLIVQNFSKNVYLASSKMSYELIVNMNPGYYYFSKAISKQRLLFLNYLKISKKTNNAGLVIDGSISSPVFGLCCDLINQHFK